MSFRSSSLAQIFRFLVVCTTVFASSVHGVCYCPWKCEGSGECRWRVAMCNDQEAASECEKANWEISDMQSSLGGLIARFLDDALENKNMTTMQAAYARSFWKTKSPKAIAPTAWPPSLASSATTTRAFRRKVRDSVDAYQEGIPVKLEGYFRNGQLLYNPSANQTYLQRSIELGLANDDGVLTQQSVMDFLEIVRFRTLIKTARIRCASYDSTSAELEQAAGFSARSSFLALLGVVATATTAVLVFV